jgi:hypothetical protein
MQGHRAQPQNARTPFDQVLWVRKTAGGGFSGVHITEYRLRGCNYARIGSLPCYDRARHLYTLKLTRPAAFGGNSFTRPNRSYQFVVLLTVRLRT